MSDHTYNVITSENGVPIKTWTKGAARQQLLNVAQLPVQESLVRPFEFGLLPLWAG